MTIAQTLLVDFDDEIDKTRRTLQRIPENDPQWKPAEKSMPIGRLALHVARLPDFCTQIMSTEELNFSTAKFPALIFESTAHLLSELERSAAEAKQRVAGMSDEELKKEWKLLWGDRVIVQGSKMNLYRTMFLNHMVH
ncbi:MAG: hypothetical protein JO097_18220, partial [Acidobacteriaceae bacterium]|nr:hypothetical protein [Acidobacteriaceae bacterium]